MENVLTALQKAIVTGVLLGLLLVNDHGHGGLALAASGGRMGRSSCSSSSTSSTSSSFTNYSSPDSSYESYSTQIGSPVHPNLANDYELDLISVLFIIKMTAVLMIPVALIYMGYCFIKHYVDQYTVETSVLMLQV